MTTTTEPRTARELIAQQAQEIDRLRWQLAYCRTVLGEAAATDVPADVAVSIQTAITITAD